jgi:hypothetical protein
MEDVGIFYRHLVHFTVFCYILWTFGIIHGNLVYFSPFWYFVQRKIWQPWFLHDFRNMQKKTFGVFLKNQNTDQFFLQNYQGPML